MKRKLNRRRAPTESDAEDSGVHYSYDYGSAPFPPYVSAVEKRRRAEAATKALRKKGEVLQPVEVGRTIAKSFWGVAWMQNVEVYQDFESRLPRGRSYLRSGSVIDLKIEKTIVKAWVQGTELYRVELRFGAIKANKLRDLQDLCAQNVSSVVALMSAKFPEPLMAILASPKSGLFPSRNELTISCNCLDDSRLCKHAAAVLYGIAARLDERPELLFTLRGIDHLSLIRKAATDLIDGAAHSAAALDAVELSELFGIEISTAR